MTDTHALLAIILAFVVASILICSAIEKKPYRPFTDFKSVTSVQRPVIRIDVDNEIDRQSEAQ